MNYSQKENSKREIEHKSNKKRRKNKTSTIIFRIFVAFVLISGFALTGAVFGIYLGILENAPTLEPLEVDPGIYSTTIYSDATGEQVDTLEAKENRQYVTLDQIPIDLQDAIISTEDKRFYDHNGVDVIGTIRAIVHTITGQGTEGGSTLTQQVIKNDVMHISKNTVVTKLQEQYLAVKYEKELTQKYGSKKEAKDHILEVYLNTINLNNGQYGVEAGSEYYFGKPVSDLTLSECAVIASITQNPSKYDPGRHPDNNRQREQLVLQNMLDQGYITEDEYNEAMADDPYSRITAHETDAQENSSYHSYFVDYVIEDVANDLENQQGMSKTEAYNYIYNGGLQIYITQDPNQQSIMDQVFMDDSYFPAEDYAIDVQYSATEEDSSGNQDNYYKDEIVQNEDAVQPFTDACRQEIYDSGKTVVADNVVEIPEPQADMVIMDYHTGQVTAMTGGRGEKTGNLTLNRATDSLLQPGSTFKILASIAPAIDTETATAATVYDDVPYTTPDGYTPKNWYGNYRGLSTIRDCVRDSMNVVAVENMEATGIDTCYDYLKNFGFSTLVDSEDIDGVTYSDRGPSTALGGLTYGVSNLELTAAYAAIANGGTYIEPTVYTKVLDHDGNVVLDKTPETHQVIKETSAYILTNMMEDVITSGTGTSAQFKNIDMPEAGKTGTTTDAKDITFVGYTPYYVGGIWSGYDKPSELGSDQHYHLVIWRDIMEQIHKDLPYEDFTEPPGIVTADVCEESGKLAVPGLCDSDPRGDRTRTEYFIQGTQPTEYCDVHKKVTIDSSTGMLAGPNCPPDDLETMVGIVRPVPYTGSASVADSQYEIPQDLINGPVCTVHNGPNGEALEVSPSPATTDGYYVDPNTGEMIPVNPLPDTSPSENGGSDSETSSPSDNSNSTTSSPPPESSNDNSNRTNNGDETAGNLNNPTDAPPSDNSVDDFNG